MPLEDWSRASRRARCARAPASRFRSASRSGPTRASPGSRARSRFGWPGRTARDLAFAGAFRAAGRHRDGTGGWRPRSAAIPGSAAGARTSPSPTSRTRESSTWSRRARSGAAPASAYRKTTLGAGGRRSGHSRSTWTPTAISTSTSPRLRGDRLMRNNLDGTFAGRHAKPPVSRREPPRAERSPPTSTATATSTCCSVRAGGRLRALRQPARRALAPRETGLPRAVAVSSAAAGDLDGDGRLDLVFAADGAASVADEPRRRNLRRPASRLGAGERHRAPPRLRQRRIPRRPPASAAQAPRRSGATTAPAASRRPPSARFRRRARPKSVDFDGDGDLDLAFVTPKGGAALYANEGATPTAGSTSRSRACPPARPRSTALGFGSEVELKAQDLYVYRVASRPVTRLGLGARRRADVLRDRLDERRPAERPRPEGAHGPARGPAAQGLVPVPLRLRRRALALRDRRARPRAARASSTTASTRRRPTRGSGCSSPGTCSRRATAVSLLDFTEELWEAAYFDLAELSAVDHPARRRARPEREDGPAAVSEEDALHGRAPRACPGRSTATGATAPPRSRSEDGVYLGGFAPTRYQGIVAPHDLVLELPEARAARTVMLYLTGWIFYADTSINVSLSQRAAGSEAPVRSRARSSGRHAAGWKAAIAADGLSRRERRRRCRSTFRRSSTARTRACGSARTSPSTGTASSTRSDDAAGRRADDAGAARRRPSSPSAVSRG